MCRWLSAAGKVPALPRASDPRAEPTHRATARTPKRPLTEQPTEISAARGAAAKQSCAVTPDSSEAFPDLGTRPVGAALPRSTRRASPAAPTHTAPASRRDGAPDSTVRRSPALRARGPRAARQKHFLKGEEGEAAPRPPPLRPGSSRCAALRGPGRAGAPRRGRELEIDPGSGGVARSRWLGLPAVWTGTAPRRPQPRHGVTARPGAARGAEPGQRPVGGRGPTGPRARARLPHPQDVVALGAPSRDLHTRRRAHGGGGRTKPGGTDVALAPARLGRGGAGRARGTPGRRAAAPPAGRGPEPGGGRTAAGRGHSA